MPPDYSQWFRQAAAREHTVDSAWKSHRAAATEIPFHFN